jgi:hypothetical protein
VGLVRLAFRDPVKKKKSVRSSLVTFNKGLVVMNINESKFVQTLARASALVSPTGVPSPHSSWANSCYWLPPTVVHRIGCAAAYSGPRLVGGTSPYSGATRAIWIRRKSTTTLHWFPARQ